VIGDDTLLIDYRGEIQLQIQTTIASVRRYEQVIKMHGTNASSYLRERYDEEVDVLQSLLKKWDKYFPGELPVLTVKVIS